MRLSDCNGKFLKIQARKINPNGKEEAEEKVAKATSEKEEAIKAFEEEKADRKATEATSREKAKEEVVGDILQYGMGYRCSALFMIRFGSGG